MTAINTFLLPRISVIGMGLIGGSLAGALMQARVCGEIVGCDSRKDCLDEALRLGVIDRAEVDVTAAIRDADAVVVAAPVGAMAALFDLLARYIEPKTVVTDVGSTKRSVVDAVRRAFGGFPKNFVPGHPLAGGEKSGVGHSQAEMFRGRRVILTPLPNTGRQAVELVRKMWQCVGADVFEMEVDQHDEILGAVSHLPHILAYLLVDILASSNRHDEIFGYAAGGFRDFTRIASSDPGLWCDISLANRDVLVGMLGHYGEALDRLAKAIGDGNRGAIEAVFSRAKTVRDQKVLS